MRYILASILSILLATTFSQNGEIVSIKGLDRNPGNIKGSIYIPDKLKNNSRKKPLIVLLHGCTQTADQFLKITGFQKYADSLGFYLLMPEQKIINNPNKCFNWFYEKDISHQQEGESRSIISMISYTEGNYPIDTYTIYVVGISAGAAMANALLYHYPKVFNSGAIVAGGPVGQAKNPIEAVKAMNGKLHKSPNEYLEECDHCSGISRFPKIFMVHGAVDAVVDPINLAEATKQWKGILNEAINDSIVNHRYLENENINATIYIDSLGHEMLKVLSIDKLGHKYPQSQGECFGNSGEDGLHAENIGYNLTLDIIGYFGLIPHRITPQRLEEPSWEHKYVSLKRYCEGTYYQLETSKDTCQSKKFINYTLSELNGCSVSDYYFIYK